jgi:hypothetical protein
MCSSAGETGNGESRRNHKRAGERDRRIGAA